MVLARGVAEIVVKARDLASRELNKTENRMKSLARVAARTLPIAIGVAAGAMTRMGVEASKAAQQVLKASGAAGLTSDTYQALAGTLQAAGVNSRALDTAMRRLQQTFSDAARGETGAGRLLAQLGIDAVDSTGALKDMNEALPEVLEALGLMEGQTERAGIAAKVLGRNWAEITSALGTTVDEYNSNVASALDSGQIINRDLLESGADAANAWDNMGQVLDTLSKELGLKLAPAVKGFAEVVNDYFAGRTLAEVARNDVGGLRELRGELHLFEEEFAKFERRYSVEHSLLDVFPFGVVGAGAVPQLGSIAKNAEAQGKALKVLLESEVGKLGKGREIADKAMSDIFQTGEDFKSAITGVKANIAAAAGETFLTGYIRALGNEIPEAQKIMNEVTRLTADIAENATEDLLEADKALEKSQKHFAERFRDFSEKAAGTDAAAVKDAYLKRAIYFLSLENFVGEEREKMRVKVDKKQAADAAERERKRTEGLKARQAQALQVWDRYYAGLSLQREQAFGNEEAIIDAQATKREEAFKVALKQYRETGATEAMVDKARLEAWQTSTEIWDRQLEDLQHTRIMKEHEFQQELLANDLISERQRLDEMIGSYRAQLDEYDRYLDGLQEGTDRYREIMMERTRIAREQLLAQIDQQYRSSEEGLEIANKALRSAIAINRKGERESRDQFERRKQLESALIAIDTASAATAVMKNVAQAGGWSALAIAEMGFILAAGAAQFRAAQSATLSGASGGGGGALPSDSVTGAEAAPLGRRTDVLIALRGRRNFSTEDIDEIVEGISDSAARNGGYIGNIRITG